MVLVTVYSDVLKGDKSFAKYLASWYDAVPILNIIGHNGTSLIFPLTDTLYFLAVP